MQEGQALQQRISTETITDEHIQAVEEFSAEIREWIHYADFELKRKLIEDLNIWVTLAVEDGQRVLYLQWYAQEDRLGLASRSYARTTDLR